MEFIISLEKFYLPPSLIYFSSILHILTALYSQKLKHFFHSCKKIIKEKIAAAWQILMQSFRTSHTMMMKAEKYEVIHVFLEIKVFSLTE